MTPCALFDFDDTLCRGDSVVPFLLYAVKRGAAPWWQVPKAMLGYLMQRFRPQAIRKAKALTFSFIKGRKQEELDDLCRDFWRQILLPRLFDDTFATLWQLKSEGYTILVVSASCQVYMRLLPEFLPVDAVLSTVCETKDGCYTGVIGPNCRGEEKPIRIAAWLAANSMEMDSAASLAYGDSASDIPMLRLAATPMLVNPGRKLRAAFPHAATLNWR